MSLNNAPLTRAEALDILWRKGNLSWKLDSCQKQLHNIIITATYDKIVLNCSRRLGKSFALLVTALETAIKIPNCQIKYAAPTAKMVKKIIEPTLVTILKDCPDDLKPKFDRHEGVYRFKNGSKLYIEGCSDGNAENLRGTSVDYGFIDEAGFIQDLEYLINDILLPQTLTTNGRLVIASTPPRNPDHDFVSYIQEAIDNNSYIKKTLLDWLEDTKNDPAHLRSRITPQRIDKIKKSSGGEHSITWRREYMCEIIRDTVDAILPECTAELLRDIVRPHKKPRDYDAYVSIDLGWNDNHALLFAYYDFLAGKLIIEAELELQGKLTNTKKLTEAAIEIETRLWRDPIENTRKLPYKRVCDNEQVIIQDMRQLHNYAVEATEKDNLQAAVNDARIKLASKQVIISPECKKLLFQVNTGLWNKARTKFAKQKKGGHYDLVAALVYLIRNIEWNRSPFTARPIGEWDRYKGVSTGARLNNNIEQLKQLFIRKHKNNK